MSTLSMLVKIASVSDTKSMSEIPLSNEATPLPLERRSILACYAMRAAWQSTSLGFLEDLSMATSYVSDQSHFMSGKEISADDIGSVASSSILAQMAASSIRGEPLILRPTVPKALELFQVTQEIFDNLDLSLAINDLDQAIVLATSKRIGGKTSPTNRNIEIAARVWRERGTVDIEMESVADIEDALKATDHTVEVPDVYVEQDGVIVEAYDLANLKNIRSRIDTLPYYKQFYEVEHGKVWLSAILEDLQNIYGEINKTP